MTTELDAALARLANGEDLPAEPHAAQFAALPYPVLGQISRAVSDKQFSRWWRARNRRHDQRNREQRQSVPVNCRACGKQFYRSKIHQVRCASCIAESRRLRGDSARNSEGG